MQEALQTVLQRDANTSEQERIKALYTMKRDFNDIRDTRNHYCHVILTCGSDDFSQAQLVNLLEFNTMLKHSAVNFKTACL